MISDQLALFAILTAVFTLLIWGRWRYDLVAFGALIFAVLAGVVPAGEAFAGFGHPAVIIVALVLVVSRGLFNSGAIELVARYVVDANRSLGAHIAVMSSLAGALSAVMNNVGALALLMPVDLRAAARAGRNPALTLMPLSFASILGGLITLIGTPPNIIIAAYREKALGEPFAMFDFTPVGLACAAVGIAFVAVVGWRLIPIRSETGPGGALAELQGYVAEVEIKKGSAAIGKRVRELDEVAEENDVAVLGLVRRGQRLPGFARLERIRKGDLLVIQASPEAIDTFVGALGLGYDGHGKPSAAGTGEELALAEAVVPVGARIEGRSAVQLRLLGRFGVTLLGVSRQGRQFRERVRGLEIEAGDILLLLGPAERLTPITQWLGCLPLAERGLSVVRREWALAAVGIFAAAVGAASFDFADLAAALAAVAVLYAILNIVPVREVYDSIEWPVIVLLGSMIPIGTALETSGGTTLIAGALIDVAEGAAPWVVLTVLMVVTMTLSDVMNNTATAVIAAPIAISVAERLGVSPDPFLMAVAIAASCAFLTPIGHKNNTLILGPGGYHFGDYWRMGLPLELVVIAVGVPMILVVWPL